MKKILLLLPLSLLLLVFSCKKDEDPSRDVIRDTLQLNQPVTNYEIRDNVRLTLDASYPGALSYLWSPNGETDALLDVTDPGTYSVTITHPGGQTVFTIHVLFYGTTFYAPNTFTPNGDQANDFWCPVFFNVSESGFAINIYDPANKKVFSSTDIYNCCWNGTDGSNLLPDGYYYFVCSYLTSSDISKKESGMIRLMR